MALLETFRSRMGKVLFIVLMSLLIISFALWGIGDMLVGKTNHKTVATIGNVEISQDSFDREFKQETNRLRRIFGNSFNRDQARALGLTNTVLRRIVDRTLFGLGAEDLGITISDDLVRKEINRTPAFKGADGRFDPRLYHAVLRSNGYSEATLVEMIRGDLSRAQYMESIGVGGRPPPGISEMLYRYLKEKRVAEFIEIKDADMTGLPQPAVGELESYHKNNAALFTAPEYRKLTMISIKADDLVKGIAVSEKEIKEAYDQRKDEFSTPEQRSIQQILFTDEAKAKKAYDKLAKGADFLAVAKQAAGMDEKTVDLGKMTKDQIMPELAKAAFSLKEGAVSKPIKSSLGWHLIRVAKIIPGRNQTLDKVRKTLRLAIAKNKAIDVLSKLANKLEDTLGGGATLEEAAGDLALTIRTIQAIDAKGFDPAGKKVAGLPVFKTFINTAFSTSENQVSALTEAGDDGYFILRVDNINAPALRPFAEVKDKVLAAWKKDRQRKAADEKAAKLKKRLDDGADFMAAAGKLKIKVSTTLPMTRPMTRDGAGAPRGFPPALVTALFNLRAGGAASARGGGGRYVARLKTIIPADPLADKKGLKKMTAKITQSVRADLLAQLSTALRQKHPVSVNSRAIDELFQPAQ
jgi:peptidyl-prolyl cis-trans isomerase D